ncbi:MAG TPA: cytochrome C oxidase Cbb3 [Acidobacteria bacterium]|nr:cytochrome C oxidase Cbb3 [Acidobacteriota bacterium]
MALRSTMADPDATLRARSLRAVGGLAARGVSDAATVEALRARGAEAIVNALTSGVMQVEGEDLTPGERAAIAAFVAGGPVGGVVDTSLWACGTAAALDDPLAAPYWSGWGVGPENRRFQPAEHAGLTARQVPDLTLQWAVGFADTTSMWAQPTVAGGRLFIGSQEGTVSALDAKTGCRHWSFTAAAGVRTAISVGARADSGGHALFFGDVDANVYAINAATGAELWTREVEAHPGARITGAPVLHDGRLYVSVSSVEEALAANPAYPCCTFRGSVVALDAESGEQIWKTYVIPEAPGPLANSEAGQERFGPAGAAIWSAATLDVERGALYVGTGNAYTQPAAETSDAVMALDLETGAIRWTNQMTPADAFIMGCRGTNANCPEDAGPDHDFGASPALVTMTNGRDLLVVGQKSGETYGLDPDAEGSVVWQYVAGPGSALGGIEWGFAVDGDKAYFANSGMLTAEPGGLSAVGLRTGELVWYAEPPAPLCAEAADADGAAGARSGRAGRGGRGGRGGAGFGCNAALPAAITAIPGVIFSGSNDGGFRAHSAENGDVLWTFDANGEFETVNGVPARGGSINGPGPVVVDGMVYVGVGYQFIGSRPGNVLLAFGIDSSPGH